MEVTAAKSSPPFHLPLSLDKDSGASSMVLHSTPFKSSESFFLPPDVNLQKNELHLQGMEGMLGSFPSVAMQDVHSLQKLGTNPLFPELNVPDGLMDEFFNFNIPSLLASQVNTPNPPLLTPANLVQQQQQPQQQHQPSPQQYASFQSNPEVLQKKLSSDTGLGKKKRHKRPRNSFTESQKKVLDDFFDHQSHTPTRSQKLQLAKQLNSTERTVTVWFQNRRQKLVKISKLGGGSLASSPREPKPVSVKLSKLAKKRQAASVSTSHYLSPPTQPSETPLAPAFVPSLPYMNPLMLPPTTTGQAPNLMPYPMYNGTLLDPSHYMLSPVTPTFNQYAVYQQMRNMQLGSSSPSDMVMEYPPNPLLFNAPQPSAQDYLHLQQSFMQDKKFF